MSNGSRERAPRRRTQVAVFRALKLGDMLCAVPGLRAIRRALPRARITLIGLPWAQQFAARYQYLVDDFVEFPGHPRLPERAVDRGKIPQFYERMRAQRFDWAIQLHGTGPIVNPIVAAFGAKRTAGFFRRRGVPLNTRYFLEWPEHGLEIHRLLALTDFLGFPSDGDHLELPLEAADFAAARRLVGDRDFVVVHPGASVEERRWPVARFAAIADALAGRVGRIVITGNETELHLTHALAKRTVCPVQIVAGQTDLGSLGAFISQARLVVCNDTGVSHVAAAVQTPSVVISTGDNPSRWAPVDARRHRVFAGASIQDVSVNAVLDEVLRQMDQATFKIGA